MVDLTLRFRFSVCVCVKTTDLPHMVVARFSNAFQKNKKRLWRSSNTFFSLALALHLWAKVRKTQSLSRLGSLNL